MHIRLLDLHDNINMVLVHSLGPVRCQAITWINAYKFCQLDSWENNFSEIWIEIQNIVCEMAANLSRGSELKWNSSHVGKRKRNDKLNHHVHIWAYITKR